MDRATDVELVVAARTGDKAAFGQLVERCLPMARQVAMHMVGNQEVAWELAQEALLQAYLSLEKLHEPASFQSWLHGIVRNVCRTHLRSRKLTTYSWETFNGGSQQPPELLMSTGDPEMAWEEAERDQQIQAALAALSPKNQSATWLFYFEQLSIEEIAARLEASVNAIKGRLHQSRKQLRAQLAPLYGLVDQPAQVSLPQAAAKVQERNKSMVQITDLRILQRESESYVLYLFDKPNARVLQMFVGPYEGVQIEQYLAGEAPSKTVTYHYVSTLLDALGAKLQAVRIARLENFAFYAVVQLRKDEQILEVDARPSDAIANALYAGSPIDVAETVMASIGLSLPQPVDIDAWFQAEARQFTDIQVRAAAWRDKLSNGGERLYTKHARTVLELAFSAAKERNHNYIGTEHLLLGLVHDEHSLAARLLHTAGATPKRVTEAVERVGRRETPLTSEPTIVPRTVQVLDYAMAAQAQSNQPAISSEHLLLGVIREGHGMAMTILRELGVDPHQLETKLLAVIQSNQ